MDDVQEPTAQNEIVAEDSNLDTPPVDETNTSEPTNDEGRAEPEQIDAPAADETAVDPERKPRPAERRIHQLNDKIAQLQQSNQPLQGFQQPPQQFDVTQYADAEGNLDVNAVNQNFNQSVVQTAGAIANAIVDDRLSQQTALTNFNSDKSVVESQYAAELEKAPALEQAIAEEYQARAFQVTGYNPQTGEPILKINPSVRLADIAKRHVESARALANATSAEMKNAVARTADTTAIRPSGEVREDKPVANMSIAEMEKKYGIVGN